MCVQGSLPLRTRPWTACARASCPGRRSEEHTSELQSRLHLVCRLLLEKKNHGYTHRLVTTSPPRFVRLFFFNDTATTEIYTLSLHDALPISPPRSVRLARKASADR